MKDWQKVFLRAAGVAAGVTVALAAVALLLYWYSSRPKSWDTKAISFVSANAGAFYRFDADGRSPKTAGFSLSFVLANNTGRDYTVPINVKLLQRQAGTEALEEFSGKLEHAVLIPAHDRAQLTIRVDYSCREVDFDGKHESERDEATCFHDAFGDVSGLVVLDDDSKVRLTLPKPTLVTHETGKTVNGGGGSGQAKPLPGGNGELPPDSGDVFDRAAACQQADNFVTLCKRQNVRPPPGSLAAHGGYSDHIPEWTYPPSGYTLEATPQSWKRHPKVAKWLWSGRTFAVAGSS